MAQMKLDTSGLERISGGNLDSKKERQAILDYLYQLTEQLRYWQNNLEQDNLTESFSKDIDGIRSTVEDAEGNMSQILQTAESIEHRVQDVEGNMSEIIQTAESITSRVTDAENNISEIYQDVDEIRKTVTTGNGIQSFVQWDEPTEKEYGDIWIKSGTSRWLNLKTGTWAQAAQKVWGAYYDRYPVTSTWDGDGWNVISDQRVILEQQTMVRQTAEKIELTAKRTDVLEDTVATQQTQITQTADEIQQRATKTEVNLLGTKLSEQETLVQQNAEAITSKAEKKDLNDLGKTVGTHTTQIQQNAEAIKQTAKKSDLDALGKTVSEQATQIEQSAEKIELTASKVEKGEAKTLENTSVKVSTKGVEIMTGGTFSVESGNFNIDASGNMQATSATLDAATIANADVSGTLKSGGWDVLTKGDLIVHSNQPTKPSMNMVWVQPVGQVAATFQYDNPSAARFDAFTSGKVLTNMAAPVSGSGTCAWRLQLPYKVTSPVKAVRYLTVKVDGVSIVTDHALETSAGSYMLDLSGTISTWKGNKSSLPFVLDLHYMGGDDGTLHNVHRVNAGQITLTLTAKSSASSGWADANVRVYMG